MRPQVDPGIFQPQLGADVVAVKQDGIFGKKQYFGNLLVGLALFDQGGHTDFHGREIKKL